MTVEESILKKRPSSPPTDTLYFDPATGHYGEHSSTTTTTTSHELFRNHISSSRVSSSSSTSPPTTNTTHHLDESLASATKSLNSSHHIKLMEDKSQSTNSNHIKLPHYPPSKPPSSLLINRKCRSQLQLNIHRMMIDSSSGSTASSTTSASGGSSQEDDDDSEELEYGPGIVAKLASKFLKYSMVSDNRNNNSGWSSRVVSRSSHHNHKITRCSSLENVLNPVFHHRRGVTTNHPVHIDDDEDDMTEDNVYDDVEDEDEDHHHLQHHHPHRRGSEGSSSSLDDHSSSSCPSGDGMTGDDFASSSSPTLSSSSPPATLANNSNVIKSSIKNNSHRNNQHNNEHVAKNSQQVSSLNHPHSSIIRPAVGDAIGRNSNCSNNDDDNSRFPGINLSKDNDISLSPTVTTTTTLTTKSDLTTKQIEPEVTTTPQLPTSTSTTSSPVIKNFYLKQLKKKPDASGNIFLHKYVSNCHNAIRSSSGESATLNLINRRNENQASSIIPESHGVKSQGIKGGNNINHSKLLSPNKLLHIKPLNSSGSSSTSSSSSSSPSNKTTGSPVVTPTYNHSLLPHNYHVGPFSSIAPIKRAKSVDSLLMECEEPISRSVQEEREQDHHREQHVKTPKRQHLHPSHPPPPPPILESRQIVQPNGNQVARIPVPRRRPLPPPPPIPVLRPSTNASSTASKLSSSTFESQQKVTNKVSQLSSASCLSESLSTSYPVARSPILTVSNEKEVSAPTAANNTLLFREQIKDHHHHTTLNTLVDENQDNDTFPQLTPPSYPPPALPAHDEEPEDMHLDSSQKDVETKERKVSQSESESCPDHFFSREREVTEITRPVSEVTHSKTTISTEKRVIPQDNATKGSSENKRVTSPPNLPRRPQRQRDRLSKPFMATTTETHFPSTSLNKPINTSSMTDGDDSMKEVRDTLITVIDVATTSVQDHLIMDSGASNVSSLKAVSDKSTVEKGGEGVTIRNEIDSHTTKESVTQSTVMESDSKSENNNLTSFKLGECKNEVTIEEKSSISSQSSSFQRRRISGGISGGGRSCSLTRGSTLPPVKPVIAQKPKSSKASASSSSNSQEVTATAGASVVRGATKETLPSPSTVSKTGILDQPPHVACGGPSSTLITAGSFSSSVTQSPLSKTPSSSPSIISHSLQSSLESSLKQPSLSSSSSSSSSSSPPSTSSHQTSGSLGESRLRQQTPAESAGGKRAVASASSPAVVFPSNNSSNTREQSSSPSFPPAGNLSVTSCKDNNTSRPSSSIIAPPMPPPPPPTSQVIPPVSNMVVSEATKTSATTEGPASAPPVALSSSVSKATTPAPPPSNGVMIFDFRGKSVQPTLAIKSPYGRSAVISNEDAEEDFRGNMEVPEPCGIVFIGENEIIGSGNLLKKRNKKMSIRFSENLFTTFEYPSESYLLNHCEDDDEEGPTIEGDNNRDSKTFSQNSTTGSKVVDNSQSPPSSSSFPPCNGSGNNDNNNPLNRPAVSLQSNNSTAKGLGSYKPTFMASQEVSAFELGVSSIRKTSPPPPSSSAPTIPPSRSPLCIKSQRKMQTTSDVDNNPPQHNGSCTTTSLTTTGSLNNNNNSYHHKSISNQSKNSPRPKETESGTGIIVSSNNRRMELQQQKTSSVGVLERNQVNLKNQQNHYNSHVNNGHNHNHHLPVNGIKVGVGGGIVKKTSELLFPRSSTTVYSAGGVGVGVGGRQTDIVEDEEDSSIVDALIKPADSSQTSSWSTSSTTQADLLF